MLKLNVKAKCLFCSVGRYGTDHGVVQVKNPVRGVAPPLCDVVCVKTMASFH